MAKNYTTEQVLSAIGKSSGVMEYVAKHLGCTWETARNYVNKWPETKEAFALAECDLHAEAYTAFHRAIRDGERWAIERMLDTSARRNGHGIVEHKQLDMRSSDGSMTPTRIEIVAPDVINGLATADVRIVGDSCEDAEVDNQLCNGSSAEIPHNSSASIAQNQQESFSQGSKIPQDGEA